jgi:drug/metabolite transporter (DMT)-like permease
MSGAALILVLSSAAAHATWNLLAKRATTPEVFTWWMAMAATLLGLPVAAYLLITEPPDLIGWAFIGSTVVLHTGYFTFLGRAYQAGDLSVVYPAARGLGIALIPVIAFVALGESLSWPAALGVGLVLLGLFAVACPSSELLKSGVLARTMRSGLGYALLTGLMIAGYSITDKRGVEHVHPILYVVLLTAGGGLGMLITLGPRYTRQAFKGELRAHLSAIITAGVLQTVAYGLVLFALRLSPVSYVAPFREVGVVFGVILGALVLKEKVTKQRAAGAATIAAGALAIGLAP